MNLGRFHRTNQSMKGFTVVEVLTTVTITAILASLTIPTYKKYFMKTATADATLMLADLHRHEKTFFARERVYTQNLHQLSQTINADGPPHFVVGFRNPDFAASDPTCPPALQAEENCYHNYHEIDRSKLGNVTWENIPKTLACARNKHGECTYQQTFEKYGDVKHSWYDNAAPLGGFEAMAVANLDGDNYLHILNITETGIIGTLCDDMSNIIDTSVEGVVGADICDVDAMGGSGGGGGGM